MNDHKYNLYTKDYETMEKQGLIEIIKNLESENNSLKDKIKKLENKNSPKHTENKKRNNLSSTYPIFKNLYDKD